MVQMRQIGIKGLLIAALFGLLLAPSPAKASEANAQRFNPAIDTSKYFSIYSSQTMQQWQWGTGAFFNYAYRPVEFGVAGTRIAGIIDHLVMVDLWGTLGVTDWMQIGIDMPIALYEVFFNPNLPPGTAAKQTLTRLGDLRLEAKFRLINDFRHPVGLAIRPFVTFPTGDGTKLVGTDSVTGGASVIFDVGIKETVFFSWNLGYQIKGGSIPGNLNVTQDDSFLYGMGINWNALEWMDVVAEIFGEALVKDMFGTEAESPLEALGGFRFYPTEALRISAGAGAGITFGYGSPDFRGLLEVSYIKPRVVDLPPPPPPPPPPVVITERKLHITEKIHFEFDKARIRPISFHILDAVVDVLKRHPEIQKVQVEGHTDAVGSDEYNMRLSQRRAESVVAYLVAHGISKDRLVAKGMGETKPIDTNDTPLGRARNRRTEFMILQRSGPSSPPPATTAY